MSVTSVLSIDHASLLQSLQHIFAYRTYFKINFCFFFLRPFHKNYQWIFSPYTTLHTNQSFPRNSSIVDVADNMEVNLPKVCLLTYAPLPTPTFIYSYSWFQQNKLKILFIWRNVWKAKSLYHLPSNEVKWELKKCSFIEENLSTNIKGTISSFLVSSIRFELYVPHLKWKMNGNLSLMTTMKIHIKNHDHDTFGDINLYGPNGSFQMEAKC